jgi:Transcriptional regulator DsbA
MAIQQVSVNQISNPADREKLLKVIRDCSDAMVRSAAEKDFIKEATADISKQLQLPKKIVQRMVKVYYKQNYDEEVAVHEQFETLYETIVK